MPFCTQCGTRVDTTAFYCGHCGAQQPHHDANAQQQPAEDLFVGMSDRTASILCYIPVFGVIPSIIFLASQKFRRNPRIRFDGFQSIYLFVTWLIAKSVGPALAFGLLFHAGLANMIELLLIICWIFLLVKAMQHEQVHLPILGDLAARSASEQL